MGNYATLQAALSGKALLFAQTNNTPIYFENQKYEPVLKTPHIRAFFLPGTAYQAACGTDAPNKIHGVYMFNVYTPLSVGWGAGTALGDKLVTEFKRGTKIIKNDLEITISNSYLGSYDTNDAWYILPVSVSFYSYTPNS